MSVLPVLMSVLIVLELQFEKDRPENNGDCCRDENACHRGSDWSPVVRCHLLQKHAHLRKIFEGHLENKFCHLLFRPVTCTRPSFAVTALAFCLYKISLRLIIINLDNPSSTYLSTIHTFEGYNGNDKGIVET